MSNVQHKRGTRAALNALAAANGLKAGQLYLITDEGRIAMATGGGAYVAYAKQSEAGGGAWSYARLAADEGTSGSTAADTSLGFAPQPGRTYQFSGRMLLASAATTTGVRLGWAWQSGNLADGAARIVVPTSTSAEVMRHLDAGTSVAALSTAAPGTTSYLGSIEGVMTTNGAAPVGLARVTIASEILGSQVTVRAGSFLGWREIG